MKLLAIFLRLTIAITTQSFFQPDEYFQSLEPAHHLVFGYGRLTWEWLSPYPLRSVLYPALNVPAYYFIKLIIHGLLGSLTDIWVCELAKMVLGIDFVSPTYFLSLTSFFHVLSLSRSLSNSLETSLTTIALSYYPWDTFSSSHSLQNRIGLAKSTAFAALACVIRPTNAIIWLYMYGALLWRVRKTRHAITMLGDINSTYYGAPTLTSLNFLWVNLSSVSLFYGSSPSHYYLSQALPILCTTALPFALHGFWLIIQGSDPKSKLLAGCAAWTVCIYSLAGHKEWRFLHPVLPMLHVIASKSLVDLYRRGIRHNKEDKRRSRSPTKTKLPTKASLPRLPIRTGHLYLLLLSVPASVYVAWFHCTGQVKVMSYLQSLPADQLTTVGFLMPCHSTPWQAHLHRPSLAGHGRMWALGCEPPLGLQNLTNYKDQTDIFYESPYDYIQKHFPSTVQPTYPASPFPSSVPGASARDRRQDTDGGHDSWDLGWKHEWPEYFVMFGALLREPGVLELLQERSYAEVWKGGMDWEGEGKRKGAVRYLITLVQASKFKSKFFWNCGL
ncbi:glycosyltransferase family 22 protein [Serpula lacrymans var. lacrymans S7.9]|uniref:Mannosyltransferase n=1 Tax=Serpula lacrymans var. lacrymans (strain S7.9) TaxID=578457 RepID=F8P6I7_SERL9|nr:glycosyltransferase family 22 protein [Serpula lacrymans var. lacrymans S7.9]EGO21054.1 glycosyltransferase family 22 protein [Serpula lacrymans var. lacrymans S7.9]